MEAWKPEEDQLLLEIVRFFLKEKPKMKSLFEIFRNKMSGNSKLRWINIAKEFYLASKNDAIFRNEKSCREHWINNLDPHNNKFL